MTSTILSPEVEAVRALLLVGLAPIPAFAKAVNRSPRQVNTWIAEGLPIIRIGRTPYVDLPKARPWLQAQNPTEPEAPVKRGPGRPRKAVAAR
jgi:hypothetical protein